MTRTDLNNFRKKETLTMKQLFYLKKRLVQDMNDIGRLLDSKITDKWGFHYSETDDDPMIDTLDYGTQGISFETFCSLMNEYKAEPPTL